MGNKDKERNNLEEAYENLLIGIEVIQKHNPNLYNFIQDVKWDAYRAKRGEFGLRDEYVRPSEYTRKETNE